MRIDLSILFVILVILNNHACRSCHWFRNIEVEAHQRVGPPFNKTLSACIERIVFDGRTVTQLSIRFQNITTLGIDSFKHLVRLDTLSIYGCNITSIAEGWIRNVPSLTKLQISHGQLSKIPVNIIPQVSELRLNDNIIKSVETHGFGNLPTLKKLYMSNNLLESWRSEWFTNTTVLEIMDFQFNKIKTIPRRAFDKLKKLKQIFFDFNDISSIQPEAFKGIHRLEYLGLRYNKLTELDERVFPNEIAIISLMIDANYLNYLPKKILDKLQVKDLTIDGNPWKCPCLLLINKWIIEINGTLRSSSPCTGSDIPVCSYPVMHSETCIETVDTQVTTLYINSVRKLDPPLERYCTRLE